jgi:hypothetical protein
MSPSPYSELNWIKDIVDDSKATLCHFVDGFIQSFQAAHPALWVRGAEDLKLAIEHENWRLVESWLLNKESAEVATVDGEMSGQGFPMLNRLVDMDAPESVINAAIAQGVITDGRVQAEGSSDLHSFTSLHLAALNGNAATIRVLSEAAPQLQALKTEQGWTPLELVLKAEFPSALDKWEVVRELLKSGAPVAELDPLSFVGANLRSVKLEEGFSGKDLSGTNLIGADLSAVIINDANHQAITKLDGAVYSPDTRLPAGVYPQFAGMIPAEQAWVNGERAWVSSEEMSLAVSLMTKSYVFSYASKVLNQARQFAAEGNGPKDFLLYANTFDFLAHETSSDNVPLLDDFIRRVMHEKFGPASYSEILRKMDLLLEGEKIEGDYPYLPELMILMRDPRLNLADPISSEKMSALSQPEQKLAREKNQIQQRELEPYSLALTSIMGWQAREPYARASTLSIHNWGRIGQMTRDFLKYKFDTRAKTESGYLIEGFGFKKIAERKTDYRVNKLTGQKEHDLGGGFALLPGTKFFSFKYGEQLVRFDPRTYVEERRAYKLISHPDHGTLVIRNSSPAFGRDRLPYVAAWSPLGIGTGISLEELQNLNHTNLRNRFTDVLEPELYTPTQIGVGEGAKYIMKEERAIHQLLSMYEGVCQEYSDWRCNTNRYTAWATFSEDDGSKFHRLKGLHRSQGFGHLVEALGNEWDKHGENLSLALVPSDFPPLFSFPFEDEYGFSRTGLALTEERMKALEHLASVGWNQQVVQDAGMDGFFRTALDLEAYFVVMYKEDEVGQ